MDDYTFLTTMGNVAASVTVVTTFDASGKPTGLTVSAFSSVSLDPPLVLVCLGKEASSLEAIRQRGGYSVNFMAAGTGDLALAMALRSDDRFTGVAYDSPSTGVGGPILTDSIFAYFECALETEVDAGDHVIFIGRVLAGEFLREREPLVYWRRGFAEVSH